MYQSSNKQPLPIVDFILNGKIFLIVLIPSSNSFFPMLLGVIWESAPLINYTYRCSFELVLMKETNEIADNIKEPSKKRTKLS